MLYEGVTKKKRTRRRGAEKSFFFVDFPSYLEGKRSVVFLLLSRKNKHSSHTNDLAFLYAHTHTHTQTVEEKETREKICLVIHFFFFFLNL